MLVIGCPRRSSGAGFVYLRNRWYDPQSGRFLTQDPIGLAGGVNLYAYAGNNPAAFSDPYGLMAECHPETDPNCTVASVQARGNDVIVTYNDGSQDRRHGGTRAWRDNNPGNIRDDPNDGRAGRVCYPSGGCMDYFRTETEGNDGLSEHLNSTERPNYPSLGIDKAIATYSPPWDPGNSPAKTAAYLT